MEYQTIHPGDAQIFHALLNEYYREGEDADTPQEQMDGFIQFLFEKVAQGQIQGCFAQAGEEYAGFFLWALDTPDFPFSQMPGWGTILEIGLRPTYRSRGYGKEMVRSIQQAMVIQGIHRCYVSAYGPAQSFWARCGFVENGMTADNGLPIMTKEL